MKHIFLNLKRFDISPEKGGVNRLAPMQNWGAAIVSGTQEALAAYDPSEVEFVMYMPEAHLLGAAAAKKAGSPVRLGSQGVYRADTAVGGNFGAFTTNRPANAVAQMGCAGTLIGSVISTHFSEIWYGLGLVAGSFIGFTVAFHRIQWMEKHLDIHIFCNGHLLKTKKGKCPSPKVFDRYEEKQGAYEK